MLPEYLKYWSLNKPPFSLTPDPDMLYMSKQHQEGLIRLKYAVLSNKGGALLISENAGDGKTSLLARLRKELDQQYQGRCRTVFIDHPTLTPNQMVAEIGRQLGLRPNTTDKLALLNELRAFLLDSHRNQEKCLVMLDEGQMLCHRPDLLQELRILLNFCVSDAFLLTFVLSGQRPLDEAIRAMPEFYQRLPVRFFLRNLNLEDTRELIRHRLRMAGNPPGRDVFSEDGYTGIYNFSKGCPRVICSVADLALVIAHSRFSPQVDFVSVSQACSDMNRTDGAYHYFHFLKSFSSTEAAILDPGQRNTCQACGAAVESEARFCHNCGQDLAASMGSEIAIADQALSPPVERLSPGTRRMKRPAAGRKRDTASSAAQAGPPAAEPVSEAAPSKVEPAGAPVEEDIPPAAESAAGPVVEEVSPVEEPAEAAAPPLEVEAESQSVAETEESGAAETALPVSQQEEFALPDTVETILEQPTAEEPAEELAWEPLVRPEPEAGAKLKFILDAAFPELNGETVEKQDTPPVEPTIQHKAAEEAAGDFIKCSFCGLELAREIAECPNCGEKLIEEAESEPAGSLAAEQGGPLADQAAVDALPAGAGSQKAAVNGAGEEGENPDERVRRNLQPLESTAEERLLDELEALNLRKYIRNNNYLQQKKVPDPENSDLLFFPLGRLLGRSAVVQFSDGDREGSFTTRCGIIFTGSRLRLIFSDSQKEVAYESIEKVEVEELRKKDTPLLCQFILYTAGGIYRISLPFKVSVARPLSESLRRYLACKAPDPASAAAAGE